MRGIQQGRRPSAAFVVAVFALTVALGGTGYAASTLAKHSVGTTQLQKGAVTEPKIAAHAVTSGKLHKNAVTNGKLKNNAVTGEKVKDNALKGADIDEATLGNVPSATHAGAASSADTAKTLQGLLPADLVPASEYKRVAVKMQAGEEKELVRNGPLSVYARCATVGGNDVLRMYAKSDVNGALLYATWGDVRDGTDALDFLDVATPETDREWDNSGGSDPSQVQNAATPTGVTKLVNHYDDSKVVAPSGEVISWEGEAELLAFNYLGARCLIVGTVHLYKVS
jgi:hypothetical protein